jgi:hypothetical protein
MVMRYISFGVLKLSYSLVYDHIVKLIPKPRRGITAAKGLTTLQTLISTLSHTLPQQQS